MSRMVHTKYGYETREQARSDASLDRYWAKVKKTDEWKRTWGGGKSSQTENKK